MQWRSYELATWVTLSQAAGCKILGTTGATLRAATTGLLTPVSAADIGLRLDEAGATREALALMTVALGMAWLPRQAHEISEKMTRVAANLYSNLGPWRALWCLRGVSPAISR